MVLTYEQEFALANLKHKHEQHEWEQQRKRAEHEYRMERLQLLLRIAEKGGRFPTEY